MRPAAHLDLGRAGYRETLGLQHRLVDLRVERRVPDTLLLVEHPEVVTLGRRRGAADNVLDPSLPVVEVERGGDATYHGPGQLVLYPILLLPEGERDLHAHLRALEEGLVLVCRRLGLDAERRPGLTGVWLGSRKVASIGIAVRRWVTYHGAALNVATDLDRFRLLRPCGLDPAVMISLSAALRRQVSLDEVRPLALDEMSRALDREFLRPLVLPK